MLISLALLSLTFACLTLALTSHLCRKAPHEAFSIRTAGLSASFPILAALCLVIAFAVMRPVGPVAQQMFAWVSASVIALSGMLGLLMAGDAGRWERTTDLTNAGARRVHVLRIRKWIPRIEPVIFMPRAQPRMVRFARLFFGMLSIIFVMNSMTLIANGVIGRRPDLASTPVLMYPSTLSMMLVDRLSNEPQVRLTHIPASPDLPIEEKNPEWEA